MLNLHLTVCPDFKWGETIKYFFPPTFKLTLFIQENMNENINEQ